MRGVVVAVRSWSVEGRPPQSASVRVAGIQHHPTAVVTGESLWSQPLPTTPQRSGRVRWRKLLNSFYLPAHLPLAPPIDGTNQEPLAREPGKCSLQTPSPQGQNRKEHRKVVAGLSITK